jgi:uncharacterized protein YndB with AHSA1/START domain
MPATRKLSRTVTLPTAPAQAWRALTDPARANGWLARRVDVTFEAGARGTIVDDRGVLSAVHVHDVSPGTLVRFVWWAVDGSEAASRVEIVLQPVAEGTRLVVTETAVPDAGSAASPRATGP